MNLIHIPVTLKETSLLKIQGDELAKQLFDEVLTVISRARFNVVKQLREDINEPITKST